MGHRRYLLSIAIGALIVHGAAIAYVSARLGGIDGFAFASLDAGEYHAIARNLAKHGSFSQSESPPLSPDTWRTPGYPLFLAGLMLAGAGKPTVLILTQQALAILSVLLVFRIASAHLGPWAAAATALIVLLEPYHVHYSFWLLSTTFFTFILLAAWLVFEHFRAKRRIGYVGLLGILAGFLVLIWPGAMLIPLFLVAPVLLIQKQDIDKVPQIRANLPISRWVVLVVLAVTSAALPGIWMMRNKIVAGHFALSHQSGIVLAYFKATEVELWRQGRAEDRYVETSLNPQNRDWPHPLWDKIDEQLRKRVLSKCAQIIDDPAIEHLCNVNELTWVNLAQGNKTSHDSFAISHLLSEIGASMLLDSPTSTITCWLSRIAENLVFPLGLALAPPREAPVHRAKAGALGVLYLILTLSALVGAIRARRAWPLMLFPMGCLIALSLTTSPQIDPRFRVPMIPLLAFLALLPYRRKESAESSHAHPR